MVAFSASVVSKAKRYVSEGALTIPHEGCRDTFLVQGSDHYIVRLTFSRANDRRVLGATCSCPHGKNIGSSSAQCSHVVAALLVVRDGLDVPVNPHTEPPTDPFEALP